ncbi:hypothetical protein AVEN_46834-1, partial [Araneus ventricosus]
MIRSKRPRKKKSPFEGCRRFAHCVLKVFSLSSHIICE